MASAPHPSRRPNTAAAEEETLRLKAELQAAHPTIEFAVDCKTSESVLGEPFSLFACLFRRAGSCWPQSRRLRVAVVV